MPAQKGTMNTTATLW